ncbi:hypothetical protein ACFPA8_14605 [Streptomyces ovatisporus]|uniref:Uncharacterized protein n=1 Tax=Streptomyces ovatisporus TaxID=1128682 RepID=A0ABV9A6Y5_9ACTN
MTTPAERALSKARLHPVAYSDAELTEAEARLTARITQRMVHGALHFDDQMEPARAAAVRAAERDSMPMMGFYRQLKSLCQTVVGQELHKLQTFLAHRLLEPEGALVLGCVLSLADREDSARFWWQFAAGAGDRGAACCLYLHHMALGEGQEAELWRGQANVDHDVSATPVFANCRDLSAVLRLLEGLRDGVTRFSPAATAVIAYVPAAVGYVDDVELPLPDPDFLHRIEELTTAD